MDAGLFPCQDGVVSIKQFKTKLDKSSSTIWSVKPPKAWAKIFSLWSHKKKQTANHHKVDVWSVLKNDELVLKVVLSSIDNFKSLTSY